MGFLWWAALWWAVGLLRWGGLWQAAYCGPFLGGAFDSPQLINGQAHRTQMQGGCGMRPWWALSCCVVLVGQSGFLARWLLVYLILIFPLITPIRILVYISP